MSRPHDPQRPFFPFGNPFRMISPKGSRLSPKLQSCLNEFEEILSERLRKLMPKEKGDVLSLSWMRLAMESLCETHNVIKDLINELELPISDWDEKWLDMYLDISVNLLDISNCFSSVLMKLSQGHLLLQCVLHNLHSSSPKQFERACSSLDSWREHVSAKNPRLESCRSILDNLVGSLDLPKVNNSAKGKVLIRAMYGVKVETVFVCSIFAAAFSGSTANLLELNVSDTLPWAQAFSSLQANINVEVRNLLTSGRYTVLSELEAVGVSVNTLYPMVQGEADHVEEELLQKTVVDLGRRANNLSQGVDLLTKSVDGFFKIVLSGRDALLCNLRATGTAPDIRIGRKVEQVGK